MGIWSRFNPDILENAEITLIQLCELSFPVQRKEIPLASGDYIHAVICGDPSKPLLVLIHGFMGGGLIFYRMLKMLETEFHLYLVDLLGMGRSSRPHFRPSTVDEAEAFFTESLEEMFETEGLESFILAGHSLGGYVSGAYTVRHPHRVSQLILISSVGVKLKPEGYSWKQTVKNFQSRTGRTLVRFVGYMFSKDVTPADILRKLGPFSGSLVRRYTRNRFPAMTEEESTAVTDYLEQMALLPGSGEYALSKILELGAWARKPLAEQLATVSVPMVFYYGDEDWMSPTGAVEVAERTNANVYIEVVQGAGHHIYMDNPYDLARSIVQETKRPGRRNEDYQDLLDLHPQGR